MVSTGTSMGLGQREVASEGSCAPRGSGVLPTAALLPTLPRCLSRCHLAVCPMSVSPMSQGHGHVPVWPQLITSAETSRQIGSHSQILGSELHCVF